MVIRIKEFKYFVKRMSYKATTWKPSQHLGSEFCREKHYSQFLEKKIVSCLSKANAQTHKRKSKSTKAHAHTLNLFKLRWKSETEWENLEKTDLKNKNTFTFSGKGWRSLCVSSPSVAGLSLSPVCLQLSGYHNHPHPNPITAQHCIPRLTHTHTHPCVHITHHASPSATHHTPTQCLHPSVSLMTGRERTGTTRIKIRTRSERETNEQGSHTEGHTLPVEDRMWLAQRDKPITLALC